MPDCPSHRTARGLLSVMRTQVALPPSPDGESRLMKDYRATIEKLRTDAAEAALIRDLTTDTVKRRMYGGLHERLNRLADEVERAMNMSMFEAAL